jgi:hypothetical protein
MVEMFFAVPEKNLTKSTVLELMAAAAIQSHVQ